MRREHQALGDARLYVRLHDLREQQARRAFSQAQTAHGQAEAQVQRRAAELAALQAQRIVLLQHLAGDAVAQIARLLPTSHARREVLEDLIERCQYALYDDEAALADTERQLDAARTAWQRAHARCDAAGGVLHDVLRRAGRAAERRLEADPHPSPLPQAGEGAIRLPLPCTRGRGLG